MKIIWVTMNNTNVDYAVDFNGQEIWKTVSFQSPQETKDFFDRIVDKWLM